MPSVGVVAVMERALLLDSKIVLIRTEWYLWVGHGLGSHEIGSWHGAAAASQVSKRAKERLSGRCLWPGVAGQRVCYSLLCSSTVFGTHRKCALGVHFQRPISGFASVGLWP